MISIPQATEALTVSGPNSLLLRLGSVHFEEYKDSKLAEVQRVIEPDSVPLVEQVLAWLDSQPAPPANTRRLGMRDPHLIAATVCVRWSTYLALLSDANRPLWPTFRQAARKNISCISDPEMHRTNLEMCHAYATWITLQQQDSDRFWLLVAKADFYLTEPLRVPIRAGWNEGTKALFSFAIPPANGWKDQPTRALANALMFHAVRNGRIEDIHAGVSVPLPLDQRRISAAQTRHILTDAASRLAAMWYAIDHVAPPELPWAERIELVLTHSYSDSQWSLSDQTRSVSLEGPEPRQRNTRQTE